MALVVETKTIDAAQETMWRILSDIPRYAEWQVIPAGEVANSIVIRDAGVLTGSARRIELAGGGWYEEEFYEAAAPNYVAYRVLRDSTGKFSKTFNEMSVSIKAVPAPGGGTNVTLSVNYKKSGLGRWIDIGGPRSWKQAFRKSLANLAEVAERTTPPEVFTPSWREPAAAPEKSEPEPARPEVEVDTSAIDAELDQLHKMKAQMGNMGLSTEEIDARIAKAELEKLRTIQAHMRERGFSTEEIDARIAELEAE